MDEFSLIDRYCTGIGASHVDTRLAVGDDAAIVRVPESFELAVAVDTMVSGVHFYADVEPARLAVKILAVNLSDMAAMGAVPKWATLALTLPATDSNWLSAFSASLHAAAKQHGVQLIGGDTTHGPLTLTLQIMGLVPAGQALTRSGARVGDDVYVSGELGDAALALLESSSPGASGISNAQDLQSIKHKLEMPQPQCSLGEALLQQANACIDVSDGLLADLGHIARASGVAVAVQVEQLPLSSQYQQYLQAGGNHDLALVGGDDYQLAFTLPHAQREFARRVQTQTGAAITRIGRVEAAPEGQVSAWWHDQQYLPKQKTGYQHFS